MKRYLLTALLAVTVSAPALSQDILMRRPLPRSEGNTRPSDGPQSPTPASCPDDTQEAWRWQGWSRPENAPSQEVTEGGECRVMQKSQCVRQGVYCAPVGMSPADIRMAANAGTLQMARDSVVLPDSECEAFTGDGWIGRPRGPE